MAEHMQMFVSCEFLPNALSIKMSMNSKLSELERAVQMSVPDTDGKDFKLFCVESQRWLPSTDEETLFSFDLRNGGRLDYRSPVRFAKVRFLNDSIKTLRVDETKSVADIVADICNQLDIEHPEELSLVVAGDYQAPGQVGRHTGGSSPIGTLSRAARPASFNFDMLAVNAPSPLGTPKITVRQVGASSSPTPPTSAKRFTLGRSSPSTLSPSSSPVLSPASQAPRSPSERRKVFSPSAMSAAKKDSPLLEVRRSNTMPSSPSLLRAARTKATTNKSSKNLKHFSKRHGLRLNTPWLDPTLSLHSQGVAAEEDLIIMHRMFYWTSLDKGTRRVDLLFIQAKVLFLNGEINCSDEKAAQFAALLCQCQYGDFTAEKCTAEWLGQQRQTLLPSKLKVKEAFLQRILQEHQSLMGVTNNEAKCLLVQLWSTTSTFGYEFFSCAELKSKKKGLIGVSKTKAIFIPHDAKTTEEEKSIKFEMSQLSSWSHSIYTETVRLTFHKTALQVLLPDYSAVLADCLKGHLDLRETFKTTPGGLDKEYAVVKTEEDHLSPTASRLQLTIPQSQMERDRSLTFEDVYWSERIGNPLVSEEENVEIRNEGLWHNPVYDKMEQLVGERFQFLDDLDLGDDDDGDDMGKEDPLSLSSPAARLSSGGGATRHAPASVPTSSFLSAPVQPPLTAQVTQFVSSNETAAKQECSATPTSGTGDDAAKKKKKKDKKKKRDLTFGEMLNEAGVKDTYSDSDDGDDDTDGVAMAEYLGNGEAAGGTDSLEGALWG